MVDDQLKKTRQVFHETQDSVTKLKNSLAEFLLQDLATALTFAQLAHDSEKRGQPEDANRQRNAAIQAYQAVLRFLPEANPTPSQKTRIEADLGELESKLRILGVSPT